MSGSSIVIKIVKFRDSGNVGHRGSLAAIRRPRGSIRGPDRTPAKLSLSICRPRDPYDYSVRTLSFKSFTPHLFLTLYLDNEHGET